MFIRYFLNLEDPYDRIEAGLLSDPWTWIPGLDRIGDALTRRLHAMADG